MAIFSHRYNLVEETKLQKGSLEDGTRNLLWNILWRLREHLHGDNFFNFAELIWCDYLKNCSDEFPYKHTIGGSYPVYSFLKDVILNGEWYQVFDILELASIYGGQNLIKEINDTFIRENCAYRFIDKFITEITSDVEVQEVENAVNSSNKNTRTHLEKALEHLSDRQNPDYRNAIKESISAVETLCRNITGESTLDRALNKLENKGVVFNSQLKEGLKNIYTYTNGKNGIRHALMDGTTPPTKADAKFMIVMCSAFINYIRENGING